MVGTPAVSVELVPGNARPGEGPRLFFSTSEWREKKLLVQAPSDAAFLQATFSWGSLKEAGETDGILYCDDAAIVEIPPDSAPDEPGSTPNPE